MSRRSTSRSRLRQSPTTPLEAVVLLTVVVGAAAIWAAWTLATPRASGLAGAAQLLQYSVAPLMLWSLVITGPGLFFAWRHALKDQALVQHARATRAELGGLTPEQFERWCGARLEALGYQVRHVAGSGDHGVDLVAERDGAVTVVQCKRNVSNRTVSESQVRDLFGAMHDQQAARALLLMPAASKVPAASLVSPQ